MGTTLYLLDFRAESRETTSIQKMVGQKRHSKLPTLLLEGNVIYLTQVERGLRSHVIGICRAHKRVNDVSLNV